MIIKRKNNKTKEQENNWEERVIQVKRVTKVVKGGKKLSFRAIIIVGNEKGQVGVGIGKATDVIGAVKKGVTDAKKHIINVALTKTNSIPHKINGISGAAEIIMRPSAPGSGVIAGGSVRTVLELAGIKNILSKQLGSNNVINNARATINALNNLRTFQQAAKNRGIDVNEMYDYGNKMKKMIE
uniref:Small ribosomal subunit protein uS5c n=1 Tax=Synarthrophyton chejuense TaxID=2485825 RepID=A0A3G3MFX1_9FLOR|nr:ribosomal protein S5 [Synarthrophyton chejuense]AYR05718.1 ribosomal protein S5 [Synarthrophyton chejuense]